MTGGSGFAEFGYLASSMIASAHGVADLVHDVGRVKLARLG